MAACTRFSLNLYVANNIGAGRITMFTPGSKGNQSPYEWIHGHLTKLDDPIGIAIDAAGNMYVSNSVANTITVYRPGADGDPRPIETIKGSNTGLLTPVGLAIR